MRSGRTEQLASLQKNTANIRNICIMAHVDHGKTTLADALVASNGVISQKMAGKLRYLDSREDEQKRGITMKSSSIALQHRKDDENYLINLIDSPGHVDFSNEVSTAVRLCDGALILVDVVEGVCSQTKVSLRQAWREGLKPVLILNKVDRLITERKLTPLDAHVHLQQTLEQVNAVMGELFTTEFLGKMPQETKVSDHHEVKDEPSTAEQVYDWSSGLEDTDDSHVYFSPDQGNVIFASAVDGWGFSLSHFVSLYAKKLCVKEEVLRKTLWGDFYVNSKAKRIVKGAQAKAKKPLFVQFILENIWAVYEAGLERRDKEMLEKIINSLNLKINPRDMKHSDSRVLLQAIMNQWLPLSKATLDMICEKLPSPLEMSEERAGKLMCLHMQRFDALPPETQELKKSFLSCASSEEAPTIVFISKMFAVDRKSLPRNKQRPLTSEEIVIRREQARLRLAQREMDKEVDLSNKDSYKEEASDCSDGSVMAITTKNDINKPVNDDDAFIAFARVFSGTIRKGQRLYVLGPKHNPANVLEKVKNGLVIDETFTLKDLKSHQHITSFEVDELYLLMGRELESLNEVSAGNVLGIGNLEEHVLKTATVSSSLACPPFTDASSQMPPIVRVAVEPVHPGDMFSLIRGLKLLNQADAAVQVLIQESGEHVIVTAGEVHLQRCLDDLKLRFAKVDINASEPIVPFRETVIIPPKIDMAKEVIEDKNQILKHFLKGGGDSTSGLISLQTANKLCTIKLKAIPLPTKVTNLLEEKVHILKLIDKAGSPHVGKMTFAEDVLSSVQEFQVQLKEAFDGAGKEWTGALAQIWAFGPKRTGPNILLGRTPNYQRPSVWQTFDRHSLPDSSLSRYDGSFIGGFQLAVLAGPLCEEPMRGVCFIVEDWDIVVKEEPGKQYDPKLASLENTTVQSESFGTSTATKSDGDTAASALVVADGSAPYGPFSGQIMSAVKEGCRRAFQAQPQRLMTAMYSCNIQVTADVLGRMYAVLGKRNGRVLSSDLQEGSQIFNVTATLPVIESFNFTNEMRKQTSGLAMPQLVFSHWEVVDTDPFWVPSTEEEYALFGEKADSENRARRYMNAVRRRKGLPVDEKIVEHAEKQRTLTRNK